jgi:hypothetical protein
MGIAPITDTERFFARVERRESTQCWWWTGAIHQDNNYPVMRLKDGSQRAISRFAWEVAYLRGPIPAGFIVTRAEHDWEECADRAQCVHRLCMNPDHMRLESKSAVDAERMRTVVNVTKTICRRGHPLTDDNVVWVDRTRNKRMCRICYTTLRARYALARH